ncbi:SET domain-containing protein [Tieghemostelium lacteum]|uniref:SET domain-containing protein n=1 Tax=Tieghemostelium lacteum TaxID=361077 RepID=A0A152A2G9_TIELA|nr:SET domain-containing protein [Tieghemostelium lacteum]|eukprot:KYR00409.1 SET domain-containing protein [Tieghemostelium lacteum]
MNSIITILICFGIALSCIIEFNIILINFISLLLGYGKFESLVKILDIIDTIQFGILKYLGFDFIGEKRCTNPLSPNHNKTKNTITSTTATTPNTTTSTTTVSTPNNTSIETILNTENNSLSITEEIELIESFKLLSLVDWNEKIDLLAEDFGKMSLVEDILDIQVFSPTINYDHLDDANYFIIQLESMVRKMVVYRENTILVPELYDYLEMEQDNLESLKDAAIRFIRDGNLNPVNRTAMFQVGSGLVKDLCDDISLVLASYKPINTPLVQVYQRDLMFFMNQHQNSQENIQFLEMLQLPLELVNKKNSIRSELLVAYDALDILVKEYNRASGSIIKKQVFITKMKETGLENLWSRVTELAYTVKYWKFIQLVDTLLCENIRSQTIRPDFQSWFIELDQFIRDLVQGSFELDPEINTIIRNLMKHVVFVSGFINLYGKVQDHMEANQGLVDRFYVMYLEGYFNGCKEAIGYYEMVRLAHQSIRDLLSKAEQHPEIIQILVDVDWNDLNENFNIAMKWISSNYSYITFDEMMIDD